MVSTEVRPRASVKSGLVSMPGNLPEEGRYAKKGPTRNAAEPFFITGTPWYRNYQMKRTALKWCGLAPVQTALNEEFEITGSIFTRGCIWEFTMPKDDLEKWIYDSPGLRMPKEIREYNALHKIFTVYPQGGAVWGEVEIYYRSGEIRIYTYWS